MVYPKKMLNTITFVFTILNISSVNNVWKKLNPKQDSKWVVTVRNLKQQSSTIMHPICQNQSINHNFRYPSLIWSYSQILFPSCLKQKSFCHIMLHMLQHDWWQGTLKTFNQSPQGNVWHYKHLKKIKGKLWKQIVS